MLKKLLKYDLRASLKLFWLLAICVLGTSVLGALAMRNLFELTEGMLGNAVEPFFELFYMTDIMMIMLSFFMYTAFMIWLAIMIYIRFFKNFFTDEGYLTFTLPVRRRTLLLSKLLSAVITYVAGYGVIFLGICIYLIVAPPTGEGGGLLNPVAFTQLGRLIGEGWREIGGWLIVFILEAILLLVVLVFTDVSFVQFCVTLGAISARKHKLLAALGVYFGVNWGLSFIGQFFSTITMLAPIEGFSYLVERMGMNEACMTVAVLLLLISVILMAAATLLHFLTLGRLERKLNLA